MSSGADGEPNGWSGTREGVSEKIDDLSITVGRSVAAIGIEYRRAVIVDDGVKVEFYKVTPTFEVLGFMGALGTSWSVMDYSDDAWAFFERIEASMRKMLDDASAFFGLEPEQAKLLIESNGVKFLSAGDK